MEEFLAAFQIDVKGLGGPEHQYLHYLCESGSASLESLAIHVGLDCGFVRHQIEPLLIRENLVVIGRNGRRLTPAGKQWINQSEIKQEGQ